MTEIRHFRGRYEFLSNFDPVNIEFEGDTYPSVEHAYQAAKTLDPQKRAKIRAAYSPGLAKKMGRSLKLREGWNEMRVEIMRELLADKFSYSDLAERLLETGDAELVFENGFGEAYWGVYEPPVGESFGQNMLGKLLMEIRKGLQPLSSDVRAAVQESIDNPAGRMDFREYDRQRKAGLRPNKREKTK
jgi:ribA/ribD-fused uncharacterized protein